MERKRCVRVETTAPADKYSAETVLAAVFRDVVPSLCARWTPVRRHPAESLEPQQLLQKLLLVTLGPFLEDRVVFLAHAGKFRGHHDNEGILTVVANAPGFFFVESSN